MIRVLAILAALCLFPAIAEAKKPTPTPPPPPPPAVDTPVSLPLKASDWTYIESNIKKFGLSNDAAGNITFAFPEATLPVSASSPHVDYLTWNGTMLSMAGHTALSASFQITTTGTPQFNYKFEAGNTCITPATTRLIILQADWQSGGEYQRWWSNPISYVLAAGSDTLTVSLNPTDNAWSDVYGHFIGDSPAATAGFLNALANTDAVGVVFGGGCFFGHGVDVSGGSAEYSLKSYVIQ